MKAVCVNPSSHSGITPVAMNEVRTVFAIDTCACGELALDVGVPSPWGGTDCTCGMCGSDFIWWFSARRFRPLLGDEQEALDTIEQEVKETELIPEPA